MTLVDLLLRMVLALAVVFGLLAFSARVAKRRGIGGLRLGRRQPVEVVSRTGLSKSASVVVVRVGERDLLLGVTSTHVELLVEAEEGALCPSDLVEEPRRGGYGKASALRGAATPASAWTAMLEHVRERTVRRA
ncbi:MAG: FliO/MopB family protein [Acidimicrobiales bacterium]